MSQQLSELCTILVEETFGGLPSALFATLVARGRQSLLQLQQHSKLSSRYLQNGLAILVQLQLVSYYPSPDDIDLALYEANLRNAYDLVRIGKHAQLVESQFGKAAAAIVSEFQCHRFLSASDLLDGPPTLTRSEDPKSVAKQPHDKNNANVESAAQTDVQSTDQKRDFDALEALFLSRHIVQARDTDFTPALDLHEDIEIAIQKERYPSGPKGKQKTELVRSVLSKKRRLRDDNQGSMALLESFQQRKIDAQTENTSRTTEENGADDARPRKQRRLNGGRGYGLMNGGLDGTIDSDEDGPIVAFCRPRRSGRDTSPQKRSMREYGVLENEADRPNKQRKLNPARASSADSEKHAEERPQNRRRVASKTSQSKSSAKRKGSNGTKASSRDETEAGHLNGGDIDETLLKNSSTPADTEQKATNGMTVPHKPNDSGDANGISGVSNGHREESEASDEDTYGKGAEEDGTQDVEPLDEYNEPFFRVNPEKFDVSMRSQRLVELATKHFGEPTSKVYAALLRCLERKIPRCFDKYAADGLELDEEDLDSDDEDDTAEEHNASSAEVNAELDPKLDLSWTKEPEKAPPKDKANTAAPFHSDRIYTVEQHLHLLAEHGHQFVHPVMVGDEQNWHVDFHDLTTLMIQLELEDVISTRFDGPSARIVRFLNAKGKLDEKRLADLTLILQRDLRAKLASMQEAGYVDLQEVPRDIGRQPSRTIFLWFFDKERCRKLVLDDTYKMMARLLQRAKVEKEKVQIVIEKSERTDVVGREDRYLTATEKAALAEWHRKEEKFWVQVARLDDMVALLRDFLPPSMM